LNLFELIDGAQTSIESSLQTNKINNDKQVLKKLLELLLHF